MDMSETPLLIIQPLNFLVKNLHPQDKQMEIMYFPWKHPLLIILSSIAFLEVRIFSYWSLSLQTLREAFNHPDEKKKYTIANQSMGVAVVFLFSQTNLNKYNN